MTEIKKIEITSSKSKLAKLLVFSILFLCAGLWMIKANPQTSNPIFNNSLVKAIASYGAIIMGLWGIYFFGKGLFNKKPSLIIDDKGIYEYTTAYKFGFIPWSDISQINETTVQASIASKQHFVTIGLTDPNKYILKEKNPLKRKLLSGNARNYGSPIHISTNALKVNHDELLKMLREEFGRHILLANRESK